MEVLMRSLYKVFYIQKFVRSAILKTLILFLSASPDLLATERVVVDNSFFGDGWVSTGSVWFPPVAPEINDFSVAMRLEPFPESLPPSLIMNPAPIVANFTIYPIPKTAHSDKKLQIPEPFQFAEPFHFNIYQPSLRAKPVKLSVKSVRPTAHIDIKVYKPSPFPSTPIKTISSSSTLRLEKNSKIDEPISEILTKKILLDKKNGGVLDNTKKYFGNFLHVHEVKGPIGSILLESLRHNVKNPINSGEVRLYTTDSMDIKILPKYIQETATPWYSPSGNLFSYLAFEIPHNILTELKLKFSRPAYRRGLSDEKYLSERVSENITTMMTSVLEDFLLLASSDAVAPLHTNTRSNDAYLSYKKCASSYTHVLNTGKESTINLFVGFSINLNMTREQCRNIDQPATSLFIETGKNFEPLEVSKTISEAFLHRYIELNGVFPKKDPYKDPCYEKHRIGVLNSMYPSGNELFGIKTRFGHAVYESLNGLFLEGMRYEEFRLAPLITACSLAQLLEKKGLKAEVRWPHHVSSMGTDFIISHGLSNFEDFEREDWAKQAYLDITGNSSNNLKKPMGNFWRYQYEVQQCIGKGTLERILFSEGYRESPVHISAHKKFSSELHIAVMHNLRNYLKVGFSSELKEFLKKHTYLKGEQVYAHDGKSISNTFEGVFMGFGENGEALIKNGGVIKSVNIGGIWFEKTGLGDCKQSSLPWRHVPENPSLEPRSSKEQNNIWQFRKRVEWMQEIGRPYKKWDQEQENLKKDQELAYIPKELRPSIWCLRPPLELDVKKSTIDLPYDIENKLASDNHFKTLNFSYSCTPQTHGRGFVWESVDHAHHLTFSFGHSINKNHVLSRPHLIVYAFGRLINKAGERITEKEFISGISNSESFIIPVYEWKKWPLWFSPFLPVDLNRLQSQFEADKKADKLYPEAFPVHESDPPVFATPSGEDSLKKFFEDDGFSIVDVETELELFPEEEHQTPTFSTPIEENENFTISFKDYLGLEKDESAFLEKDWRKKFNIPENWLQSYSRKGIGIKYQSQDHPQYNEVRIMKAKPQSDFAAQKVDYVKIIKNGVYINKEGKNVKKDSEEAHIPIEELEINIGDLWKE